MTTFRTASLTTVGARETNQDRVCCTTTIVFGKPAVLIAVADGMGGMKAGDKAAGIAIDTVSRHAREVFPALPNSQEALRAAIEAMFQEANRLVWEYAQQNQTEGMGTTLVFCLACDGRYLVANAGDSRCYYVNDFEAWQITEDHNQVQELVLKGSMTPEAARRSPYRNQLTNSLGEPHDIRVDIFPSGMKYGIIDEDCVFMVCSDGLHGEVTEQDLHDQLHGTKGLDAACSNLASLAYKRGSTDNISVAAVEFGELAHKGKRLPSLPSVDSLLQKQSPADAAKSSRSLSKKPLVVVFALIFFLLCAGAYTLIGKDGIKKFAQRLVPSKPASRQKKGITKNKPLETKAQTGATPAEPQRKKPSNAASSQKTTSPSAQPDAAKRESPKSK